MTRATSEIVAGRLPVLVSVSDTALEESIGLAKVAADAGADAVVLATPYYFPAGQTELIQYIRTIVPKLPLPLLLYNMPATLTKVWFEIETLKTLSDIDRIIGIKDSGGDLDYFEKLYSLRDARPDWSFFIGPEEKLIKSVALGGNGGVNGSANICKLFVDAYHSARDGDEAQQLSLQKKIEDFGRIYEIGKYASRFIKGTKSPASILGLCDDRMAEPFNRFYPEDRKKVENILDELDLD